MKQQVRTIVELVSIDAESIWPEHLYENESLGGPLTEIIDVGFFDKSADFGLAFIKERVIHFNIDFIQHYGIDKCMDWIIHEIAHIITGIIYPFAKQHHGKEFREICGTLGGTGKTKHPFDIAVSLPPEKLKHRVSLDCVCGTKMHITKGMMEKIRKAPADYFARCCNATLDQVIGGHLCSGLTTS